MLLGFVYWSTASYMARQADAAIAAEIEVLAERYSVTGVAGLTSLIQERLGRQPAGPSIYLLAAAGGTPLTGNLRNWPRVEPDDAGWLIFRLGDATASGDPEIHGARARSFRLRGGYALLVGRDMHELEAIQRRIARATGFGLAIALLLALVGGAITSRTSLSRIAAINATVDEIMTGQLSRRIPKDDAGDDFSQLVDNLNRMLDEIESSIEGVRQVSDNIAHDLRTPLARLRNRLDELQADGGAAEGQKETVERAIREADGLLATFGALLRIARIEAGARRAGFQETRLARLVADVVELYEPVAEERGQRLSTRLEIEPIVQGDPDLLSQAVANLIDNALKHSPPDAEVVVAIEGREGQPLLSISDRGPGIPKAETDHVFRRFYRLDSSRSSRGSGLGLSLVAAVAKLHGITVDLADNHPGLRVTLRWPSS